MISKAKLREQISSFPRNEISMAELMKRLIFIEELEKRITASEKGEVMTENQVAEEIKKWSL